MVFLTASVFVNRLPTSEAETLSDRDSKRFADLTDYRIQSNRNSQRL